jgi:hypothetical protein
MFIVAMLLISGGYSLAYWGIDNIVAWISAGDRGEPSSSLSDGTSAVELPILFGLPYHATPDKRVRPENHPVPFPYFPTKVTGEVRPIDNTSPMSPTPATPNNNPIRPV